MLSKHLPKIIYLFTFSLWMTFITLNNITDPETNTSFIKNVLTMDLFTVGSGVGEGLLWRAVNLPFLPNVLLWGVITLEAVIDFLMWSAFFLYLSDLIKKRDLRDKTLNYINLSISAFMSVFTCLLCSGMWFGYWMHQGSFQMVHLLGIIISILGYIMFNSTENKYL
ncbi:hypothetical protein A3712_00315 [Vibrio sp. HI00D65]|uniref:DUF2165 family protein n=1 Tax=Vibrio sp. HI00D65 TaxID=1822216 RepID=UPI0007B7F068|nr:DUF2165 family protein [Vibrio sp. HI00D65]KZX70653.1 hypothetical protein A3712_00315 [Vibrio sp. HI00D65]